MSTGLQLTFCKVYFFYLTIRVCFPKKIFKSYFKAIINVQKTLTLRKAQIDWLTSKQREISNTFESLSRYLGVIYDD